MIADGSRSSGGAMTTLIERFGALARQRTLEFLGRHID
jgi:hypothetical protein